MSLQLRNLTAHRGRFELKIDDLQFVAGALHSVVGANGAGKSSLFAALSGELAYRGDVVLHGVALRDWPSLERARHLGVLPQQVQLNFPFTALEVVELGLTPLSVGWREGRRLARDMLRRTDCLELADSLFPSLSGGQKQRVNLARVLLQLSQAQAAPVLLLDEPTSAQDLGHQHEVLGLAKALAKQQGYLVLAILHDLNQALRYADHCVLLDQGQPVATGAPDQVLDAGRVARYWGYRPRAAVVDGVAVLA